MERVAMATVLSVPSSPEVLRKGVRRPAGRHQPPGSSGTRLALALAPSAVPSCAIISNQLDSG